MEALRQFEIQGGKLDPWDDFDEIPERTRRKAARKGKRLYQVVARLEPAQHDLFTLGQEIVALTGRPLLREPTHEDRALGVNFGSWAKDPAEAIDRCSIPVRRLVKKLSVPVVRVSFDTREVPA